jgi:hypothetical protein
MKNSQHALIKYAECRERLLRFLTAQFNLSVRFAAPLPAASLIGWPAYEMK